MGAVFGVGFVLSAGALASSLVLPPDPPFTPASSGDVRAAVSVVQEDDGFPASPGLDYHAKMSWWSTKETSRTYALSSLKGKGNFTASVNATIPAAGDPCGNSHYYLTARGQVEALGNLQFNFVPKDINHPGRGLKGWSVFTPIALWKGTMHVDKGLPCENATQGGGSTFDGVSLVGGTKTGGTTISAPSVTVNSSGRLVIRGSGTVVTRAAGTVVKRQIISFTVSCERPESCFGVPEDGSNGLEHSFKFLGATCEPGPGGTVRMRVRVRMQVRNGGGISNWAQGMRAQVRLVPTSEAGLNYNRNWATQYKGGYVQNTRYSQDFVLLTDTVSPTGDWRLEFKYTWDRNQKLDVVEKVKGQPIPCA